MSILTFIAAGAILLVTIIASMTVVPWIGQFVVRVLTFGRIELGWRPSDRESEVSLRIGYFVLLVTAGLIAMLLHN